MARRLPRSLLDHRFDPTLLDHRLSEQPPRDTSRAIDWIEGMLEQRGSQRTWDSTAGMVETMHHFDLVFEELQDQISRYSPRIARLQGLAWKGVLALLKGLIKTYHRHAKQTQHLREEAQAILKKHQRHELAQRQQSEDYTFDKASLRAQIRNVQGELESLAQENRVLSRERNYLRAVVRDFIHSGVDFNGTEEAAPEDMRDVQRSQLAMVQSLDVGMNAALDESLLEYHRFSSLVHQLTDLWESNEQPPSLRVASKSLARVTLPKEDFSPAVTYSDVGVQVDEKDLHGVLESESSVLVLDMSKRDILPMIPWDVLLPVPPLSSHLAKFMGKSYEVKRIPSLEWLHQQIYAMYEDKILFDKVLDSSEEGRRQMRVSFAEFIHNEYFTKRFHLPSNVDIQCALLLRAVEVYMDSSSRVRF